MVISVVAAAMTEVTTDGNGQWKAVRPSGGDEGDQSLPRYGLDGDDADVRRGRLRLAGERNENAEW